MTRRAGKKPMWDYCGYCGQKFKRRREDPPEICQDCLADPVTAGTYAADYEYDLADNASERDLADRARRGK